MAQYWYIGAIGLLIGMINATRVEEQHYRILERLKSDHSLVTRPWYETRDHLACLASNYFAEIRYYSEKYESVLEKASRSEIQDIFLAALQVDAEWAIQIALKLGAIDDGLALDYAEPNMMYSLIRKHGFNVNKRDEYGNTALHRATQRGDVTRVMSLLKYGANEHIVNYSGKLPRDLIPSGEIWSDERRFLQRLLGKSITDQSTQTDMQQLNDQLTQTDMRLKLEAPLLPEKVSARATDKRSEPAVSKLKLVRAISSSRGYPVAPASTAYRTPVKPCSKNKPRRYAPPPSSGAPAKLVDGEGFILVESKQTRRERQRS